MVIIWLMMVNTNLVGGIPTPLKNMTSSVGMMTFPTEWKNKIHVPNHQPDLIKILTSYIIMKIETGGPIDEPNIEMLPYCERIIDKLYPMCESRPPGTEHPRKRF